MVNDLLERIAVLEKETTEAGKRLDAVKIKMQTATTEQLATIKQLLEEQDDTT